MKFKSFKLLAFYLYLVPFVTHAQNKLNEVFLKGTVLNFSNQIFVEDISEMKNLAIQNANHIFIPDNIGNFEFKFELGKPNYFRIGRNILYLTPGDSLSFIIDYEYPENAVFIGLGSHVNEYLRYTPFPNAGSFLDAGNGIKATIELTIEAILGAAKKRQDLLSKCTNVSPLFRKLENARIRADILNSLFAIPAYFPGIHKIPKDSIPSFMVKYTKISGAYITKYKTNFMNPQFLQLDIYRRVIRIINESKKDKQAIPSQIDNWLKAESVALKINQEKQKEKLYSFLPEINKLKYPLFKKVLLEKIRVLTSFNDGDTAKNFIGADSNNIQFHLTQFRGKIIYIDLWATWCGPCLQEMPFLDNLKERYKDNPGIVFLSFSIDDNQELWKKSLIKRKLTGLQLITSRGDLKEYNPIVIPRTIIIDKSFIISAMNGPLPSSENTTNLLDSLLKK